MTLQPGRAERLARWAGPLLLSLLPLCWFTYPNLDDLPNHAARVGLEEALVSVGLALCGMAWWIGRPRPLRWTVHAGAVVFGTAVYLAHLGGVLALAVGVVAGELSRREGGLAALCPLRRHSHGTVPCRCCCRFSCSSREVTWEQRQLRERLALLPARLRLAVVDLRGEQRALNVPSPHAAAWYALDRDGLVSTLYGRPYEAFPIRFNAAAAAMADGARPMGPPPVIEALCGRFDRVVVTGPPGELLPYLGTGWIVEHRTAHVLLARPAQRDAAGCRKEAAR